MFPLKRFIQGPSLHDEVVSYEEEESTKSKVPKGPLTGEEVSKQYEEIINLPSTSTSAATASCSSRDPSSSSFAISSSSSSNRKAGGAPPPKLTQLFSLCESNDHPKLEKIFEEFDFDTEIDIDARDEYGWTMLMSASCAGSLKCVSILLQNGANWTLEDKKGMTAVSIAEKQKREEVSDLLEEWISCYIERLRRQREFESEEIQIDSDSNDSAEEAKTKKKKINYCDACRFQFESSKEEHDKSIAHLVSTSQFGKDRVHFGIPESNKGFQLMVKSGWDKSSGLGPEGTGNKFPVKTILKRNKLGLGNEREERKKAARITHFGPFDSSAVEYEQQQRTEREVTLRRKEAAKVKSKERRKEINYRREFASL